MSTDRDELHRLHAEAYRQYKRGMRRAWLGLSLSTVAAGVTAGVTQAVVQHCRWPVPLWARVLCLLGLTGYITWRWRPAGKRLPHGIGLR